jgi:beta-carotene hydroxylase
LTFNFSAEPLSLELDSKPLEANPLSRRPTIKELGHDLLTLSRFQLVITVATPFIFFALYFLAAFASYWPVAIACTMALSFCTYGSTSHDLVHENLKLQRTVNTVLLSVIELICFRSGHAYKLSHLHHHKRYPHDDDVEGAAAHMSFFRTLVEGVIFQFKICRWAILKRHDHKYYNLVVWEGLAVAALIIFCICSLQFTVVFFAYMCLMIAGSWIIPLVTSYAVHSPEGVDELRQTRLFRGSFFSFIAFDHLYHLEHHLYPMVPHKNWKKLASRLDTYFKLQGIKPIEIKL